MDALLTVAASTATLYLALGVWTALRTAADMPPSTDRGLGPDLRLLGVVLVWPLYRVRRAWDRFERTQEEGVRAFLDGRRRVIEAVREVVAGQRRTMLLVDPLRTRLRETAVAEFQAAYRDGSDPAMPGGELHWVGAQAALDAVVDILDEAEALDAEGERAFVPLVDDLNHRLDQVNARPPIGGKWPTGHTPPPTAQRKTVR